MAPGRDRARSNVMAGRIPLCSPVRRRAGPLAGKQPRRRSAVRGKAGGRRFGKQDKLSRMRWLGLCRRHSISISRFMGSAEMFGTAPRKRVSFGKRNVFWGYETEDQTKTKILFSSKKKNTRNMRHATNEPRLL